MALFPCGSNESLPRLKPKVRIPILVRVQEIAFFIRFIVHIRYRITLAQGILSAKAQPHGVIGDIQPTRAIRDAGKIEFIVVPDRHDFIISLDVGFNLLVDTDILVSLHDGTNLLQIILKYKMNSGRRISILSDEAKDKDAE